MMIENKALISIITPAYNAVRFIGEAIESVLAQTYTNWEMIIVDDCSTDGTVELVTSYTKKDPRIQLVQLAENSGSAVARNTAMDHAKGRYLAFLDSDDMWLPEKLEKQLAFMQNNNVGFSFTKYVRMTEDGKVTNAVTKAPATVDYETLMKQCVIGCLTVMLDRERVGEERMINIRTRQDYAFWLSLTKKGIIAYGMPEVLAKYRIVENSISSNKIKAAKQNWQLYRYIEGHSFLKASWYFGHYAFRSVKSLVQYKLS